MRSQPNKRDCTAGRSSVPFLTVALTLILRIPFLSGRSTAGYQSWSSEAEARVAMSVRLWAPRTAPWSAVTPDHSRPDHRPDHSPVGKSTDCGHTCDLGNWFFRRGPSPACDCGGGGQRSGAGAGASWLLRSALGRRPNARRLPSTAPPRPPPGRYLRLLRVLKAFGALGAGHPVAVGHPATPALQPGPANAPA